MSSTGLGRAQSLVSTRLICRALVASLHSTPEMWPGGYGRGQARNAAHGPSSARSLPPEKERKERESTCWPPSHPSLWWKDIAEHAALEGTSARCLPGACPASNSMSRPSIPMLYPRHTERAVLF